MTFNDTGSAWSLLSTRRSGKPRDMVAPGPAEDELRAMIAVAGRTPDHGKLAPWRFVIVPAEARGVLERLLVDAWDAERPTDAPRDVQAVRQFAHQAPALVVALHSPRSDSHIPLWEQELSTGAAVMNLGHAAHARGYVAGWLTGWASFSPMVRDAFGAAPERIAGFVFIGTSSRPLEERPRPDPAAITSVWRP